jgi:hypothetical protein
MNSGIDNSERDEFFNECLRDYADAMTALATFQSWAADHCEAALKRSENALACFAVEKPAAYSAFHRPEKPLPAAREFRCGAQANSRGKDGPNVVLLAFVAARANQRWFPTWGRGLHLAAEPGKSEGSLRKDPNGE